MAPPRGRARGQGDRPRDSVRDDDAGGAKTDCAQCSHRPCAKLSREIRYVGHAVVHRREGGPAETAVTVKVVIMVLPAGTTTVAGTDAAPLLALTLTVAPPEGAPAVPGDPSGVTCSG